MPDQATPRCQVRGRGNGGAAGGVKRSTSGISSSTLHVVGLVDLLGDGLRGTGVRGFVLVEHRPLAVVLHDLAPGQLGAALVARGGHATKVPVAWFRGSLRSHLNHRG